MGAGVAAAAGGGYGLPRPGGRAAAMNVQLSADETYADIVPVRQPDALSAFVSIMRGCNNMVSGAGVGWRTAQERAGTGSGGLCMAPTAACGSGGTGLTPHHGTLRLPTCPCAVLLLHRPLHPRPRAQPADAVHC